MKRFLPDPDVVAVAGMLLVLVFLVWRQTHPRPEPEVEIADSGTECIGEPITVAYAYTGAPENPHECAVQCLDDQPRYILYTNGRATQCDTPPSCNDRGEDDGVTCTPPTATVSS